MSAKRLWFCTLFDRNYLTRGVALYRSLERWAGDFTLFVLCMDDESYQTMSRLEFPNVRLIRLAQFEDDELLKAKVTRSAIEYYWTCTPSLPLYVFDREPEADLVTYLDSDLYFYSEPAPLYDEMGAASVMIHEHRFPPRLAHYAANGIYNVGWVSFRRDDRGLAVARRWRDQCNEWCFYKEDNGRLGDQKYLDTWTQDFEGVHVLQHKGGGTAPWNIEQYRVHTGPGDRVFVDDVPLVFYHFHGLRLFDNGSVDRAPSLYPLRKVDVALIYDPYLAAVRDAQAEVDRVAPGYRYGLDHRDAPSAKDELLRQHRDPVVRALIPVHNRLEYTRACLRCLEEQDYPQLEVVVIDDGSTDGTAQALATEFPDVTVLRGDGQLWWTGAVWWGVTEALRAGAPDDFVLFINNDTTFEPDYVSTLVRVSREREGAIVGSLLRSWTDRSLISFGPVISWPRAEVYELAAITDDPERLCEQDTIDTLDALPGRGLLVPAAVFRRVGNFRRRLLPHYIADYEFAARAKRHGEKLILSTHAAVYTAPDPPSTNGARGFREALRAIFSRRSSTNLFDHFLFFAVSAPLRYLPLTLPRVLRYALVLPLRDAARAWLKQRLTGRAGPAQRGG
jgi:GT2 family glycosyltransferase